MLHHLTSCLLDRPVSASFYRNANANYLSTMFFPSVKEISYNPVDFKNKNKYKIIPNATCVYGCSFCFYYLILSFFFAKIKVVKRQRKYVGAQLTAILNIILLKKKTNYDTHPE